MFPIGGLLRHDFILFSGRLYGVMDAFGTINSCTATRFACNKNDLGSIRKFVDHRLGEGSPSRNVIQTKEWDRFIGALDVPIETNERDSRLEHIVNRCCQSSYIIGIQNDAVPTLPHCISQIDRLFGRTSLPVLDDKFDVKLLGFLFGCFCRYREPGELNAWATIDDSQFLFLRMANGQQRRYQRHDDEQNSQGSTLIHIFWRG